MINQQRVKTKEQQTLPNKRQPDKNSGCRQKDGRDGVDGIFFELEAVTFTAKKRASSGHTDLLYKQTHPRGVPRAQHHLGGEVVKLDFDHDRENHRAAVGFGEQEAL